MASMRVFQLAKELHMSSKDMLAQLKKIGIDVKSHASMLTDDQVKQVYEAVAPEAKAAEGVLKGEDMKKLEERKAKEKAEKEKAEAKRLAAVKAERESREKERAQRHKASPRPKEEKKPAAKKAEPSNPYAGIEDQIKSERERVANERAQAKIRARQESMKRAVAKKQEVEERLHGNPHRSEPKPAEPRRRQPARQAPKTHDAYKSLLSQIESEQDRMKHDRNERNARNDRRNNGGRNQNQNQNQRGRNANAGRRNNRRRHGYEPEVPELEHRNENAGKGKDRYAKMAHQAEKMQRDKVLAEAREAVKSASHQGEGRRQKRKERRKAQQREQEKEQALKRGLDPNLVLDDSVIEVPEGATVKKFAECLKVPPNEVIKRLMLLGNPLTLTQPMSDDLIELIADDMKRKVRVVSPEEEYQVVYHDDPKDLKPRPPVVTVMGHVDHGKTSLLDAIRSTGVAEKEAGGITQRIGASVVHVGDRQITFIDTPGHEAFTAMRARGAQITDVVVLVVAADDGVMPQTVEAIHHARAAKVPIVVAVNKIDKPGADPNRVRQELTKYDVIPEEWGGKNMFVDVSAKKHLHIDTLLETILLQADVLELKANPNAPASGYVIESKLDKGRGPVATVLVERGTLKPGDAVVAGTSWGRVRALLGTHGERIQSAAPADPAEILGLNSVATAGDEFRVFEDERDARKLAEERSLRERLAERQKPHMSLDQLFDHMEEGKTTELNLVVKADVMGSIDALKEAFSKMDQSEVHINIIHSAVGGITETDVQLAAASDAIIIGFNVRPTGKSKELAKKEKVDMRFYRVIYQAIDDINAARVGLLKPVKEEKDIGSAEVRNTFKVPRAGLVAGCYVTDGEIDRNDKARVVRDGTIVFDGNIGSLRRFKDDVKTVKSGYECGIGIEGFQDIKVGDVIETYREVEVKRTE